MQPALRFRKAGPPAASGIFAGQDGPRAVRAPETGIALIVQGIVRNLVLLDVGPDLIVCPTRQRVKFDQRERRVPFNDFCLRPRERLFTTNACDPGLVRFERAC
jgi:hypothetical protein